MNKDSKIEEIEIHQNPKNITKSWKFTTLYKYDVHGNKRLWQIVFENDQLHVHHGVSSGKIQTEDIDIILNNSGKNIGEQAFQEASTRYIKYIRDGYIPYGSKEIPLQKAMKGSKFEAKKIKNWPVAVDPKLDGIRFLIRSTPGGKIEGRSWTNIVKYHLDHIIENVRGLFDYLPPYSILDGELYIHNVPFYTIASMFKSDKNIHPELEHLEYHIYDIAIEAIPFENRKKLLTDAYARFIANEGKADKFSIVPTYIAQDEDEVFMLHDCFIKMGFEGSVVKKMANDTEENYLLEQSFYKFNKRCDNVMKIKNEEDDEFEIQDVVSANGRDKGTGVFILKSNKDDTITFKAKPMGDFDLRKEYLINKRKLKGEFATVIYNKIDSKTGVPINPRVKCVRDYE